MISGFWSHTHVWTDNAGCQVAIATENLKISCHLWNMICAPEEDTLVLWTRRDVSSIRREAGLDLIWHIGVAFVFTNQAEVPEVVQTDPAVRGGYQDPVLARHGLDTSHLPTSSLLAPGTLNMDCRVIFQLVSGEEYNSSIIGPNNYKLS